MRIALSGWNWYLESCYLYSQNLNQKRCWQIGATSYPSRTPCWHKKKTLRDCKYYKELSVYRILKGLHNVPKICHTNH